MLNVAWSLVLASETEELAAIPETVGTPENVVAALRAVALLKVSMRAARILFRPRSLADIDPALSPVTAASVVAPSLTLLPS